MKTKVMKPAEDDIEALYNFLALLEFYYSGESIKNLDEREPERILYEKIKKEQKRAGMKPVTEQNIMQEMVERLFFNCSGRWIRVINAAIILIDQLCDPSVNHISLHPYFKRANQNSILGE